MGKVKKEVFLASILLGILSFVLTVKACGQSVDSVYMEINKYVDNESHCEIIVAQSVLECGWYKYAPAMECNNIFGMMKRDPNDGSRYILQVFDSWQHCVAEYYRQIYSRYTGGDYYQFLLDLPYATSKYVDKVKPIVNQLFNERRNQQ